MCTPANAARPSDPIRNRWARIALPTTLILNPIRILTFIAGRIGKLTKILIGQFAWSKDNKFSMIN